MLSIRKTIIITFILVTILSVSLIFYTVYLFFGAYDVGRLLDVAISKIEVIRSGNVVSINISLQFDNPSKFALQLVYAAAFVYLNGQSLTPSYAPSILRAYSNPILLPPFSQKNVSMIVGNVPGNKVPTTSSKHWVIELSFLVDNIPLIGIGTYTHKLGFTEAGA
jgi:hypothetical protein